MNQPEKKIRIGSISATVWNNPSPNGEGEYKTVSLERGYKDKHGQWKNTNSFRESDIPKAMLAMQKAYEFCIFNNAGDEDAGGDSTSSGGAATLWDFREAKGGRQ